MKKLILSLVAIAAVISGTAQTSTGRINDVKDAQLWMQKHNLSSFEKRDVVSHRLPFVDDAKPDGTEQGITDPEGTHYNVAWSGHTFAVFQEVKFTGYCGEMVKSDDGSTVYFFNIMPDFQTYWLKGEIDSERNVVVIPNDQLIYEEGNQKYYFVGLNCELDEYGYAKLPEYGDMQQCQSQVEVPLLDDGGIDATGLFFWLWSYASINTERETDGYMSYCYSMVATVIDQPIETPPSDLEFKDYFFSEKNISYGYEWADTYGYLGGVAVDGSDLYLKGLCSECPETVIRLSLDGDKATLTSGRILTDGRFYYTFDAFNNVHEVTRENNGYTWTELFYDIVDEVSFSVTDDAVVIPEGYGVTTNFLGGNPLYPYWYVETRFDLFAGNLAATPADPTNLYPADFWEYGFANVSFFFTCQDRECQWINPRNCFYELYLDNALYSFSSDIYDIPEGAYAMSQVPVLYSSNDFDPYDEYSFWQSDYVSFRFREPDLDWWEMKLRIGYTDDKRETYYSDFATYYNPKSSANSISVEPAEVEYYNMQGMRVVTPIPGQVYIRLSRTADGSTFSNKILYR